MDVVAVEDLALVTVGSRSLGLCGGRGGALFGAGLSGRLGWSPSRLPGCGPDRLLRLLSLNRRLGSGRLSTSGRLGRAGRGFLDLNMGIGNRDCGRDRFGGAGGLNSDGLGDGLGGPVGHGGCRPCSNVGGLNLGRVLNLLGHGTEGAHGTQEHRRLHDEKLLVALEGYSRVVDRLSPQVSCLCRSNDFTRK